MQADVLALHPVPDDQMMLGMSGAGVRDSDGRTALHSAVIHRRLQVVQYLLDDGADPTAADRLGFTPLHFAAQDQVAGAVPMLITAGAEIDARDCWGNTPLFRAVFNSKGRGETIRALLDAGADADINNDSGVSPRLLAATIGNYDIVQFL